MRLIGWLCTCSNIFSRPVLISRSAYPPPHPFGVREGKPVIDFPKISAFFKSLAGDNSEEATPDPIPNSEVKLFCVDGTAWVTVWESRELPAFFCFFRF